MAPREHRIGGLSANFHNPDEEAEADLTQRYEAMLAHYGITPTRNNAGIRHENGGSRDRTAV